MNFIYIPASPSFSALNFLVQEISFLPPNKVYWMLLKHNSFSLQHDGFPCLPWESGWNPFCPLARSGNCLHEGWWWQHGGHRSRVPAGQSHHLHVGCTLSPAGRVNEPIILFTKSRYHLGKYELPYWGHLTTKTTKLFFCILFLT